MRNHTCALNWAEQLKYTFTAENQYYYAVKLFDDAPEWALHLMGRQRLLKMVVSREATLQLSKCLCLV